MGNSNSEVMKSIMEMKTPITNRIDICLEDCKDDIMRMNLIKLRKTEILSKLKVVIKENRMIIECPPYSYSIPFDSLEAREVLNFLMEDKKKEQSLEKTNPCPLDELLKDKEAVKELADIFADSVVNKFAERFGSPREPKSNNVTFRESIKMP